MLVLKKFFFLLFLYAWLSIGFQTHLYGQSTDSIGYFLNRLESTFDIHFIHENKIFEESRFSYESSIFERSLEEILKYFEEQTPFRAIRMVQDDDTTTKVYVIKREDSKVRLSGRIVDQQLKGLPYATVRVPSMGIGTVSKFNGDYEFEIDAGKYEIEASFVGLEAKSITVDLAPGDHKRFDFLLNATEYLDEVIVTGSRNTAIGTLVEPSTIIEHGTIASLINLKGREIDAYVELSELLQVQQASFQSVHQHISDGTDHIDPATLRGMGPDQTLVLINGKRRHQSAFLNISNTVGKGSVFTDLNTIPISIIERIEILQDGAASQYGSDAIAGVINIILKENNYSEVNIKSGISSQQDGFMYDIGSNFGMKLSEKGGFINLSLNHYQRDPTNRTDPYTGRIYPNMSHDSNPQFQKDFFDFAPFDSTDVTRFGQSNLNSSTLFANISIPLHESLELYGFGGLSFKKGESVGVYRFPYQLIEEGVPNSFGFSPKLATEISDQAITIGLKKIISDHAVFDISNTYGQNSIIFKIIDPSVDGGRTTMPDVQSGEVGYGQNTTNADFSYIIDGDVPATISVGAEFRLEDYTQKQGDFQLTSDIDNAVNVGNENLQLFPRFSQAHSLKEYRTNIGTYLDIEADPSAAWKLGASVRFERYEDFGSNLSWKLYSRWKPFDNYAFKFSYNTGFRAPSLHQYYYTSRLNQYVPTENGFKAAVVDHYNHHTIDPNLGSTPLSDLQVDPLGAEYSTNFSLGFVSRPFKHWTLSANLYQIDVDDRIILTGYLSGGLDEKIQNVLDQTNSTDVQFFTNAIGTKTQGIEFITKYYLPFQNTNGGLGMTFSGHLNRVSVKEIDDTRLPYLNSFLQPYEDDLFNRSEVALYESAQPSSKMILAMDLNRDWLNLHLRLTRFGEVTYVHPLDGDPTNYVINTLSGEVEARDQTYSAKYITDISTQIRFMASVSLSFGIQNLFDVYPDQSTHSANRGDGMFPYNRFVQQFGTRGRFYYTNLSLSF